jgi:cytochrome c
MSNKFAFVLIAGLAAAVTSGQTALAGDAEAGAKLFKRCGTCHTVLEGKNRVGPSLFGVYGRAAASLEGFRFSPAMKAHGASGVVWNDEALDAFIANPRTAVPKTRMTSPPMKSAEDRANLIAYLKSVSGQ